MLFNQPLNEEIVANSRFPLSSIKTNKRNSRQSYGKIDKQVMQHHIVQVLKGLKYWQCSERKNVI